MDNAGKSPRQWFLPSPNSFAFAGITTVGFGANESTGGLLMKLMGSSIQRPLNSHRKATANTSPGPRVPRNPRGCAPTAVGMFTMVILVVAIAALLLM